MEHRVLILTPKGRDAEVIRKLLAAQGREATVCEDVSSLGNELDAGAGAAVVTEEALTGVDLDGMLDWLREQPPWSDFPFVLLTTRQVGRRSAAAQRVVDDLGNVVVMERPISAETLASAIDAALRVRARQYQTRTYLQERERAEERLRLALVAGRLGSWELDLERWQLTASKTCKQNFGRDPQADFTYEQLLASVHPADRERHLETVRRSIAEAQDLDIEYRNVWPDGSEHWVQVRGQTIGNSQRTYSATADSDAGLAQGPLRMIGVSLDVTERRLAEMQLRAHREALQQLNETLEMRISARTLDLSRANDRLVTEIAERERAQAALAQSQKMEAIGQLTNGIAHDFNNLLTAIVGNVDMIGRRSTDDRIKRLAGYAREAANRATRLTGQLLAFSRTQRLDLKPVNVDSLILGMGDLVARSIGPAINIRTELQSQTVHAVADANQIELALLNLIINARDAMPNGGNLTISTSLRRAECVEMLTGHYVVIAVTDTGSGIPAHLLPKVFEPFFTTKPIGKGTGLGLSQVYGIAQQSGGTAIIHSTPGKGTTVEIWLPISESGEQAGARYVNSDPLIDIAHDERIVVVEDDGDVRRFIVECLKTFGYKVSEADNGFLGLDLLQQTRPDLLIVDFAMPGMNGAELAHQVRARYSDLPIIFVTGYADMDAVERVAGAKYLLKKPFEVAGLANIVRSALSTAATLTH